MPMSDAILPFLKIRSTSSAVSASSNVSGILAHHPVDDVDLLERGGDGRLSLQLDRHVDRPELPADAAGAQPRDVGHDRRLRLA